MSLSSNLERVAALHLEKSKEYGNSWCKYGEIRSIIPNILRKVDRLGSSPSEDTLVDLLVYLMKYYDFLLHPEDCSTNGVLTVDSEQHLSRVTESFLSLSLSPLPSTPPPPLERVKSHLVALCYDVVDPLFPSQELSSRVLVGARMILTVTLVSFWDFN